MFVAGGVTTTTKTHRHPTMDHGTSEEGGYHERISHRKTFPVTSTQEKEESFPDEINQASQKSSTKRKSLGSIKFVPGHDYTFDSWVNFPTAEKSDFEVAVNSLTLPLKWLLWTNKGLSGLPKNQCLRERLCNQSTSLGSVAGLYLVIAISGFFMPPSKHLHLPFSI
jgi:hypothetical protein